jgi:hypothetical protein
MPGGYSLREIERLRADVIHEHVGDHLRYDGEAQHNPIAMNTNATMSRRISAV